MSFSFRKIVEESITNLFESKSLEDIRKMSSFSVLEPETIEQIAEIDPTYKGNGYAGKFTIWLIDRYLNNEFKMSQSNDLTAALENFKELRGQLENGNLNTMSVKDLLSLETKHNVSADEDGVIMDFPPMQEMINRRWSAWYLKIFDDGSNQIFIPLTWEAARKLGGSTEWCTSSSDPFFFDYYSKGYDYPLEIFYKNGEPYAQLQNDMGELRDVSDEEFNDEFDFPEPDSLHDAEKKAGEYAQMAFGFYIKQRFEKLQNSVLTSENLRTAFADNGVCGYNNGGLWGIARYDSAGRITPITIPEWGVPISNRCGMITFMELPDLDDAPENGLFNNYLIDYSVTFDHSGRKINYEGDIEAMLNERLKRVQEGKYKLADAFDRMYKAEDGTTYLFDLDLRYGVRFDGRKVINYGEHVFRNFIQESENIA